MQRYFSRFVATYVFSLVLYSAALAAPVTAADLSGKKICWDNGSASSYRAGGKYANNMSGEGTWAVTAGGVHIHTDRYDYVASIQKLGDGTFSATVATAGIKSAGKYCK
jgi:hypothetical protein